MILLLAASAAAPEPAAPGFPKPAVNATPLGDPAHWVTPDDYPQGLAADKEGVVAFCST
jgi:hypothetical protein